MEKSRKFFMKDKRIIIIGGSGFLGQNIFKILKESHFNNVFIGDIQTPKEVIQTNYLYTNLLDFENVKLVLREFDIIINCAGQITYPINTCLNINSTGIKNIVDALDGFPNKKLIHISTVTVYGSSEAAVSEDSPLNPENPYASAKFFAEFIIQNSFNLDYVILRIPNLYGPNQTKGIIAYLLKSLNEDRNLFFNNNGDLLRHYLHIDDCSLSIVKTIENDLHGVFNIPSIEKKTVIDLINLFEKTFDVKFSVSLEKVKPFENIAEINSKKFQIKTGFSPNKTIEDLLKQKISNGNN
jgi:UDP-glucose 4-epimerase